MSRTAVHEDFLRGPAGRRMALLVLLILLAGFGRSIFRPLLMGEELYDFHPFFLAAGAARAGEDPYDPGTLSARAQEIGLHKVPPYRYPPFFTLLLLPLAGIPFPLARLLWFGLNLALLAGSVFLAFRTLSLRPTASTLLLAGALILLFDPLIYTLIIGQANLIITILLAGTVLAWSRHRPILAGGCLGLGASIKLAPAFFLPYFLWKREWRLVLAALGTMAACAGLGYIVMGPQASRTFLTIVIRFADESNAWVANQSLNGFFARLFAGDALIAPAVDNPALGRALYYAGAAILAAMTAGVLFRSRRAGQPHLEFALVLITFHLISPTTWLHHLTWMLYPLLALALACLGRREVPAMALFAVGYVLAAFPLGYRNEAFFAWPASLWISSKTYGLLLLYGLTIGLLLREAGGVREPAAGILA